MKKGNHLFKFNWTMRDDYPKERNGYKVFSCFAGGGGSTMGYKLAGYDVIGCNEIDKKMINAYILNHNPKYVFDDMIQDFKNKKNLPKKLYDLDILDGSPPCSTFSMVGNRENDWGRKRKFSEGQCEQILDTLFFDFIDLTGKLQPKVVIAENVKGLLIGNAIKYVDRIRQAFLKAGYHVEKWLLDASKMGIPQKRERVFFIAIRKDLIDKINKKQLGIFNPIPYINMSFNEPKIVLNDILNIVKLTKKEKKELWITSEIQKKYWNLIKEGESYSKVSPKGNYFGFKKLHRNSISPTLMTMSKYIIHPIECRRFHVKEWCLLGTFPTDYQNLTYYIIGMSVPPVMIAQVARRVQIYWLDRLK